MTYRLLHMLPSRTLRTIVVRFVAVFAALALLATACGSNEGGDETVDDTTDTAEVAEPTATEEPEPSATPIVLPTSTPGPTATPTPSGPLESPTPSAILLTTAFTNYSKVTTVGIDEVQFGMYETDAALAASTSWTRIDDGFGGPNCYAVAPSNGPEGVELWIYYGRVERVDIEHPDLRTPSHLGLGNTLVELQGQLGSRLDYVDNSDGSVTATFTPSDEGDSEFRIVFELEEDQVVRYRSGRQNVVNLTRGECR